jgi:AraC-like DNA-binding protein
VSAQGHLGTVQAGRAQQAGDAETDLPIGDVARRVGLPDAAYFARVFRAGNGSTPRDWRRGSSRANRAAGPA